MNEQEDGDREELKDEFKKRFVADDGDALPVAVPPPEQPPIDMEVEVKEAEKFGGENDS